MNRYEAKILLKSLLGRIERDATTERYKLHGPLSDDEVAALNEALSALSEQSAPKAHLDDSSFVESTRGRQDQDHGAEAGDRHALHSEPPAPPVTHSQASGPQPTARPVTPRPTPSAPTPTPIGAPPVPTAPRPVAPSPVPVARDPVGDVRGLAAARCAAKPSAGTTLCLDFGTALSKAFATTRGTDGGLVHFELGLGQLAGEQNTIYAVSSSVWIEDDGLVFVGPRAVTKSLRPDAEHMRFDSVKQELSQGDMSHPDRVKVPPDFNPTNVPLYYGHIITFYLAFLTDLAETALEQRAQQGEQRAQQVTRYVARRFALPSWDVQRLKWGEELLRRYLARAQIVGDVFRGRWNEGIPVAEMKAVIDAAASLSDGDLPFHLILEGVQEPLAAGASRLRADGERGLVMVIDVGAGTTDFAMFVTVDNEKTDGVRAFPIMNGVQTLRQAGDTVDSLLRQMMLRRMSVQQGDPVFNNVNARLLRTIREDKETLFKRGLVHFNDGGDTITREDFVKSDGAQRFGAVLRNKFEETLKSIDRSWLIGLADGGVKVVLTGGGATLPMVQDLAHGTTQLYGQMLKCDPALLVPNMFKNPPFSADFAAEYPQLAVAIGGASGEMPDLGKPQEKYLGTRSTNVVNTVISK